MKTLKKIIFFLKPQERKKAGMLMLMIIVMSVLEMVGVVSIVPFMGLVGDMSQLKQDTFIAQIFLLSGITSESQFVFLLGVGVLIALFISAGISIFTL